MANGLESNTDCVKSKVQLVKGLESSLVCAKNVVPLVKGLESSQECEKMLSHWYMGNNPAKYVKKVAQRLRSNILKKMTFWLGIGAAAK